MNLDAWKTRLRAMHPRAACPCHKRCLRIHDVQAKDPRRTERLRARVLARLTIPEACIRCGRTPFIPRGPCARCMSAAEEALAHALGILK